MPLVTSGVEKGNLRELAMGRMRDMGLACRDVRSREAGIQDIHNQARPAAARATAWQRASSAVRASQGASAVPGWATDALVPLDGVRGLQWCFRPRR